MRPKIRCDEECEKICKILGELNWAYVIRPGTISGEWFPNRSLENGVAKV
jgi:hypothetical protein